jgi:hypothetical protein
LFVFQFWPHAQDRPSEETYTNELVHGDHNGK